MYINFEVLKKSGLNLDELAALLAIRQKTTDAFHDFKEHHLKDDEEVDFLGEAVVTLLEKELVTPIKSGKGFKMLKKGTTLVRYLEIANLTSEIKEQYASLKLAYISAGLDKKLGKTSVGLKYYANFLGESGFTHDQAYRAVEEHIEERSSEPEFTKQLHNLICEPQNRFSTRFDLEDSKLYSICKQLEE